MTGLAPAGAAPRGNVVRTVYDTVLVIAAAVLVVSGYLAWLDDLPNFRVLTLVSVTAIPILVRNSFPVGTASFGAAISLAPAVLYSASFDAPSHVFPLWATVLAVSYPFFQGEPLRGAPRTAIQIIAGATLVTVCSATDFDAHPYDRVLTGIATYCLVLWLLDLPRRNDPTENDIDGRNLTLAVIALVYTAAVLGVLNHLAEGHYTPRVGAALLMASLLALLTMLIASRDTARRAVETLTNAASAMPWPNANIDDVLLHTTRFGARARSASFERHEGPRGSLSVPLDDGRHLVLRRGRGDLSFRRTEERLVHALVAMADASRHQAAHEQRLKIAASTDDLTGLWNFGHFSLTMKDALANRSPGERVAVFFIDLDDFKSINTELGHINADQVVRQLGHRLLTTLPADTVPARFGGDEFLVLMNNAHSTAHVESTRHRIAAAISQPLTVDGWVLQLSATIGAAISGTGQVEAQNLVSDAERDMRLRKARSRSARSPRWAGELNMIRDLVDGGGISVAYQPIVDLATNSLQGYEALVRGHHPEFGQLSAMQIVGSAIRLGILDEVTEIVAEQAITTVSEVARSLGRELALSLNIEYQQLVEGSPFLDWLGERVQGTNLMVVLELSERKIGDWHALHTHLAQQLLARGVHMAIDDFGAGHATFSVISVWDWEWVKIDRSFLSGMGTRGSVMLPHVSRMLHDLGTCAVIEGVETRQHLQFARDLGIPLAQGLRFGAPQAAAEILARPEVHGLETDDLLRSISPGSGPDLPPRP